MNTNIARSKKRKESKRIEYLCSEYFFNFASLIFEARGTREERSIRRSRDIYTYTYIVDNHGKRLWFRIGEPVSPAVNIN